MTASNLWSAVRDKVFGDTSVPKRREPDTRQSDAASDHVNYENDRPISKRIDDQFGRWSFAQRVAETLANRKDPSSLVVGLYGPWGDGKTSTLGMMEETLSSINGVLVVPFNPWYFDSERELFRGFFATLAGALGKKLPTRKEELGKLLSRYGSVLSLATLSFGGMVSLDPGAAAKGLGEAFSTADLDELKRRLEGILHKEGIRVVVMIDDIDRLDRNETHSIFKLVKLSAGFDWVSYVLAFDDEVVADALGERYGSGNSIAGKRFLEKIVQVPLRLPSADPMALRKLCLRGIEQALSASEIVLKDDQVQAFLRYYVDGIEPRVVTPRQAKLYANAALFALPILKGEVNPVDQLLIEGIRIFYPTLYFLIRDNPDKFLNRRKNRAVEGPDISQLIDAALAKDGVLDGDSVKSRLLNVLFPRLQNVEYGGDWDAIWRTEQRVASEKCFQKYFAYGVPPGEISDASVKQLFELAEKGEKQAFDELIQQNSSARALGTTMSKLRQVEDTIDISTGKNIARYFAPIGKLIPRDSGMMSLDLNFIATPIFASKLARRMENQADRLAFARQLVEIADPLNFGFEFFRWFRHSAESKETPLLTSGQEVELANVLVSRVVEESRRAPLYRTFGTDVMPLLWMWSKYGNAAELSTYLKGVLEQGPDDIDLFIDAYVGTSWGLESGLSRKSDLERSSYDSIAGVIDPNFVFSLLRKKYGTPLDKPEFYHSDSIATPERLAQQFAYVHAQAISEKTETPK